ncbi:hypothetical protein FHG66_11310 [Rubellimicrobium rubrum]|uniref:Uncharacterized protein n=1 Tax=Rubellimicrobium rubrum TaxID=2585369 RepID=A0A5C4MTU1_9RHOB|nr:hypothetical protein [Rubellimicrobium rubrum]TNC49314.1 hypothetical protein FHG66_11310 [Rubellimicrobium rubrum]
MPLKSIVVIDQGDIVEVLDERPYRRLPDGQLGIAYRRRVRRVVQAGDVAAILLQADSYPKELCPPTQECPSIMVIPIGASDADLPNLSRSDPSSLQHLWLNCLRCLADSARKSEHHRAQRLLDLIEEEWEKRGRFRWPNTNSAPGLGLTTVFFPYKEGMLSYLGYRVGVTAGEQDEIRHAILDRIFRGRLPPLNDADYMRSWGAPGSPGRLKKMADSIAAFCVAAKRDGRPSKKVAIEDWDADLNRLYSAYYRGHFGFIWPSTRPS